MKPTNILGISASCHDSTVCLVRDGEIVDPVTGKGLNRKEHAQRLPANADSDHLEQGGFTRADLLPLAFYYVLLCRSTLAGAPGV